MALGTLLRWLGPWAGDAAPPAVRRAELMLPGPRPMRCYLYAPEPESVEPGVTARAIRWLSPPQGPCGAYLVSPGLHHLGPDDPRLDRFCRVLAAAGLLVLAPFLPDYIALRVTAEAVEDLGSAWDHLAELATAERLPPPAIFSISFGSAPAITLASRDTHRDRVGPLVIFGGYAEFEAAVRFAITGEVRRGAEVLRLRRDPLNSPVVFLNLLPWMRVEGDRVVLERAWRTMVERTWGRAELKEAGAREPYAVEIAEGLPPELRELFLVGCGLRPGGAALLEEALSAATGALWFTDPRPALSRLRAPVVIVHGRDDDVIPYSEADKLCAALPPGHPHRVFLTGLYGHTGAVRPPLQSLAREAATLLGVARALLEAPQGVIRVG